MNYATEVTKLRNGFVEYVEVFLDVFSLVRRLLLRWAVQVIRMDKTRTVKKNSLNGNHVHQDQ